MAICRAHYVENVESEALNGTCKTFTDLEHRTFYFHRGCLYEFQQNSVF